MTTDSLAGLLRERAEQDNPALLFEDRSWSWRQYVEECARRGAALAASRREGRPFHAGVLAENVPEYMFLIGGAAFAGATVVGINPTRRGAELARDIRGTDCDLVIADEPLAGLLEGLDLGVPEDRVLTMDAWRATVPDVADLDTVDVRADPSTTVLLLFTSGSTAAPKAVICSTGRLARIAAYDTFGLTPADVAYNAMPLFHGNALMAAWLACVSSGAAFAIRRRFSASGFVPDLQHFGATFFNYVGRSLAYVLAVPESPAEQETSLRFGFGTEASAHDRSEFERRFGVSVFESYGSSEGGCYIVVGPDTPPGSLGRPQVGHSAVILAADGGECPPARFDEHGGGLLNGAEAIGEIVNPAGAAMFEGYYGNPTADAQRVRGSAYHTGDLGYRDADGFFWFAGRTADWMRVDSENLATGPIERLIARFRGVRLVAVYGVPDELTTGDQVMAALEMDTAFDPDDFASFLVDQPDLGTKWPPRYVRITPSMPVTATRKIDKGPLRRDAWRTDDVVYVRTDGAYTRL